MVAAIVSFDCGGDLAGEGYEVVAVFVHENGKQNVENDLVFLYHATSRGSIGTEPPILRWIRRGNLRIALRPDDIERIDSQRAVIEGVNVSYDIRLGCTGWTETSMPNGLGDAAILRTATCASGSPDQIYYVRSIFVHAIGKADTAASLVFQYRATRIGAEYDLPTIRWRTSTELSILVRRSSIEKISSQRFNIGNKSVRYFE